MEKSNLSENYRFTNGDIDLSKCAWFTHENRIYMTDSINPPMCAIETWWSFILRKIRLKKTIIFGKPYDLTKNWSEAQKNELIPPPPEFTQEVNLPKDFKIFWSTPKNPDAEYIKNEMSKLGFIETRHEGIFKFELGDSYMTWCKQTNKPVPINYIKNSGDER